MLSWCLTHSSVEIILIINSEKHTINIPIKYHLRGRLKQKNLEHLIMTNLSLQLCEST